MLSIGLVRLWNSPVTWLIYTTPALLILGYTAQYCAVTTRLSLAFFSIPKTFDEAARLTGASWTRRLFRIFVPLLDENAGLRLARGLHFVFAGRALALMTAPPGGDPLPAPILTLMANGAPSLIASLCLIMAMASLIPLAILARVIRAQA